MEPLTTIPAEWLDRSHVVIYRLAGPLLELRPTFVSKNVLGLTGFSVEQSCTPSWWFDHLHPDDRDRLLARNRALSADRPLTDSYRFQTASGSYIWVRDERWLTGPPIDGVYEVVGTWTDISDLMEANRLLAEREQRARRWERVFDEAEFGLAHADVRTNTFLEVNTTFAAERGYSPDELVGRPILSVYAPSERERLARLFATIDEQRHLVYESIHQRKDGTCFPVLMEVTTILDRNQQPVSRVAYALDITAHKEALDELRERQRIIDESQRIGQVGTWSLEPGNDLLSLSAEAARLLDLAPTQDAQWSDLVARVAPEEHDLVAAWFEACRRGQHPPSLVLQIPGGGGPARHLRLHGDRLEMAGRTGAVAGTLQDVTEDVRAQLAERAAVKLLDQAQRVANVGSWIWDIRSNRLTWSDQMYQIFGIDRNTFAGDLETVIAQAIHPEDRSAVERANRQVADEGAPEPLRYRVIHPDGTIRVVWAEAGELIRDERGRPIQLSGIVQDITQREAAAEALRRSEARHRAIFECQSVVELLVDPAGQQILDANPAACAYYGRPHEELCSLSYLDVDPAGLMRVDPAHPLQRRHHVADGTWRHVRIHASEMLLDGRRIYNLIVLDVTDQVQAEAELERLATAIQQAGEAILLTDPDGSIRYVNPAFERVTGYSSDEILGRNPRILKSGAQDESYYRELWQTISAGGTWRGRLVNRRKDGTLFTEDATISPVFTATGSITGYVAVKNDVSDRLRLEQDLAQKHKLEAVGTLAGGVAHDFNNMLNVILGNADLALADPDNIDPSYLREIRRAAEHSAQLTRQLLAFARKQTILPRSVDLNQTVEGLLGLLRRLVGEDIEVLWRPSSDLWPVWVDPSQVDQVLANLAGNARDATVGPGTLVLSTSNRTILSPQADLPDLPCGDFVVLQVEDNGRGMVAEELERAFEPFYTTKTIGSGTGLGLATVYGIVKQNQGWIFVQSAPGAGTTFSIYLPRTTREAAPSPPRPATARKGTGHHVLLVEDEAAMLKVTSQILQRMGYRVSCAATPRAALALVEGGERFDVLLTDMIMPAMSGPDLAAHLAQLGSEAVVVYMSGYSPELIASRGLETTSNFLQKPFTGPDLARALERALGSPGTSGSPSG